MASAHTRRATDIERLRVLAASSGGDLLIVAEPSGTREHFEFELRLPTAGNRNYPGEIQHSSRFIIELTPRYPFEAPRARMADTPIWHPNVYQSGVICVGSKWLPSEGLDVYVTRIIKLLCFDPLLVNTASVAHAEAGRWYVERCAQNSDAFPSATIDWQIPADKIQRQCPHCKAKMRLPTGRQGLVDCPRCGRAFKTAT